MSYTRYPRAILWLLRGGDVTMGGEGAEGQPSFVAPVEPFYLSKLPITNVQFEAYDPSFRRTDASPGDADPATGIDFDAAIGYCSWYAEISHKPMRLPTEIEWEYACRGGTSTRCYYGSTTLQAEPYVVDAESSGGQMSPLRSLKTNPFGLLAMLGGVWEWTGSLHLPYPTEEGDGRDDPDTPGPRVLRGGSFRTPRAELGSAVRRACDRDRRLDDVGFRIARGL